MAKGTQRRIKRLEQQCARLQAAIVREKARERQLDTHHKIKLGGLVVIAGICDWHEEKLLHAFLEALQLSQQAPEYETLFRALGEYAFREYAGKMRPSKTETKETLRQKIILGGLLKKAGWTEYESVIMLGMCVYCKRHALASQ